MDNTKFLTVEVAKTWVAASVRKRSKGSWEIRYEKPAGEDGKRNQCSETVRGTKKAAQAVLSRIDGGTEQDACRESFRDAGGGVLQAVSEGADWCRTFGGAPVLSYKGFYKNYLLPECGHMPLATVDRGALQRVVNTMVDRGLDAVTVHSHWGYMTGQCSAGLLKNNGFLSGNPAKDLTLPEMSDEYPGQMLSRRRGR